MEPEAPQQPTVHEPSALARPASDAGRLETSAVLDYLCVDAFLATLTSARSLATALAWGLIDHLEAHEQLGRTELVRSFPGDPVGLHLLLDLLAGSGVLEATGERTALSDRFRHALRYRELLEVRLDLALLAAADWLQHGELLLRDPVTFQGCSQMFQRFAYARALEPSAANYAATRRWMRCTTLLTRYEAPVCATFHDFSLHQRLLDVGGNSGEFALQLCRRQPGLTATICDLPLVCDVGREHVAGTSEAGRIRFVPADAFNDPLPSGHDLITFKSMLHDWPEAEARRLLDKAATALEPGGTLLIFERGPFTFAAGTPDLPVLPYLLFYRGFRPATWYATQLEALGLHLATVRSIALELPFHLITAIKPGVSG